MAITLTLSRRDIQAPAYVGTARLKQNHCAERNASLRTQTTINTVHRVLRDAVQQALKAVRGTAAITTLNGLRPTATAAWAARAGRPG